MTPVHLSFCGPGVSWNGFFLVCITLDLVPVPLSVFSIKEGLASVGQRSVVWGRVLEGSALALRKEGHSAMLAA